MFVSFFEVISFIHEFNTPLSLNIHLKGVPSWLALYSILLSLRINKR